MRLKSEERPELKPVSHEPEITIHPSANVLPMMAGEEWEEFEAGGNLEPGFKAFKTDFDHGLTIEIVQAALGWFVGRRLDK